MDPPRIDWSYPSPRKGFAGILDRFIGPGATKSEIALQFGVPFGAAIASIYHLYRLEASFSLLQYVVCGLLALDVTGSIRIGCPKGRVIVATFRLKKELDHLRKG